MSLSKTLKQIMFEKHLRTATLARKIGMPQPTLHRIVEGISLNPHPSSLQQLANYFEITIEQLQGIQPISWLKHNEVSDHLMELPILDWKALKHWPNVLEDSLYIASLEKTAISRTKSGTRTFSVKLEDASMEPHFIKGTVLIVDPDRPVKDRCFVIAHLENSQENVFRQLIINGPHQYLKPLSAELQNFPLTPIEKNDKILGVLIQAQQDWTDN